MKKKIGFFGGTFDPIHLGHLNLCIELMEIHRLHSILFCPAASSPFKQEKHSASKEHRLEMLKLALEPLPSFQILDVELKRPPPSYTIDTIRFLLEHFKKIGEENELHLLIGEDALQDFNSWKEVEELITLAPPLIGTRSETKTFNRSSSLSERLEKGMTKISNMDISSTRVRERIAHHLFCGHLLPAKVLTYIKTHNLYL